MPTSQISEFVQHLRTSMLRRDGAGLTDGQLLECFLSRRDEAAMEALVRRHGPMVWGVCRRLLNHHDAEDAFQATFLVLVRKSVSIVPREMVANWLYGVAHQTALKARASIAKRKNRERQMTDMPELVFGPPNGPTAAQQDRWADLQPFLDQELSRLPDKYRAAIVLCDLHGKTRKEVARQLGLPEGTVASRLMRGRMMLAKRLSRYLPGISGGALAAILTQNAPACVPAPVLSFTIKAATDFAAGKAAATGVISAKVAALMEGVLKTMLLSKLKIGTAVLVTVSLLAGCVLCYQGLAKNSPDAKTQGKPAAPAGDTLKAEKAVSGQSDKIKLQGTWSMVTREIAGKVEEGKELSDNQMIFHGDLVTVKEAVKGAIYSHKGAYKLDPRKNPKTIDLIWRKRVRTALEEQEIQRGQGIYIFDGDTLTICFAPDQRPKGFTTKEGSLDVKLVFKRVKQEENAAKREEDKPKEDSQRIEGRWIVVSAELIGKAIDEAVGDEMIFDKNEYFIIHANRDDTDSGTFELYSTAKPKEINTWEEATQVANKGIYELDGDKLKICISDDPADERPTKFTTSPEKKKLGLLVLKRVKD